MQARLWWDPQPLYLLLPNPRAQASRGDMCLRRFRRGPQALIREPLEEAMHQQGGYDRGCTEQGLPAADDNVVVPRHRGIV